MRDDFSFIKVQPSNGILRDKEGRTICFVYIFRPDITVKDQHWFKAPDDSDYSYLCIETGSDNFPVNCKQILRDCDTSNEWERISDEEILRCFKSCCQLLMKEDYDLKCLGGEIIDDMLSDKEKK